LADETLRYLRSLHGLLGPAPPGTVLHADPALVVLGAGSPGTVTELAVELENCQSVHAIATPMVTPLVARAGTTWFPEATSTPSTVLVAPSSVLTVRVSLTIPDLVPHGTYDGALVLLGIHGAAVPVRVTVDGPAPAKRRRTRKAGTSEAPNTKASTKKTPTRKLAAGKAPAARSPAKKAPGDRTPVTKPRRGNPR
jgi:hypothetical protein